MTYDYNVKLWEEINSTEGVMVDNNVDGFPEWVD